MNPLELTADGREQAKQADDVQTTVSEQFYVRTGTSAEPLSIQEANDYIDEHWSQSPMV